MKLNNNVGTLKLYHYDVKNSGKFDSHNKKNFAFQLNQTK